MSAGKKYTIDDWKKIPDKKAELVDGQILYALPTGPGHGDVHATIIGFISTYFKRKPGGRLPGGWWILDATSIHFKSTGRILEPDISGWKRDRVEQKPNETPIEIIPDWICEICVSTKRKDTTIVPETLAKDGVPWYWLVDVEEKNLLVFSLGDDKKYNLEMSLFPEDGKVKIPPFEAIALPIPVLFGDDPEDDFLL